MSQIRVNEVVSENALSAPHFPFGATGINTASDATNAEYADVAGIATNAQGLTGTPDITVGNIVAVGATFSGDVSIAGTITYQDVTDVNAVGVITATKGIDVTGRDINITSGGVNAAGVITATSFVGDGSGLTNAFSQEDTWLFGGA
tara:strand:+ start:47 stop:487 length:441 start_codon:yes stop_codon:yes gene_type:complete